MAAHEQGLDAYVTVKLFAWLRDLFGWNELRVPTDQAPNVRRLLEHLCTSVEHGPGSLKESGAFEEGFIVLLNGRSIDFAGGMEARLREGDEVAIFPPPIWGLGTMPVRYTRLSYARVAIAMAAVREALDL